MIGFVWLPTMRQPRGHDSLGWDATCFLQIGSDLFFGTQDGIVMQADRTGFDDGHHEKIPYTATLVGGWETFGNSANQVVWHQARAVFVASAGQPFAPQLSASQDYVVTLPAPPSAGHDPGTGIDDKWDLGKWGEPGASSHLPTPAESAEFCAVGRHATCFIDDAQHTMGFNWCYWIRTRPCRAAHGSATGWCRASN